MIACSNKVLKQSNDAIFIGPMFYNWDRKSKSGKEIQNGRNAISDGFKLETTCENIHDIAQK